MKHWSSLLDDEKMAYIDVMPPPQLAQFLAEVLSEQQLGQLNIVSGAIQAQCCDDLRLVVESWCCFVGVADGRLNAG